MGDEIREFLERHRGGKIVVVGVGNTLRGDDGVGPKFVERIKDFTSDRFVAIDAGEVPENYLGKVAKLQPDVIILVDATNMGETPGTMKVLTREAIEGEAFFTHKLPLSFVMKHWEDEGFKVFLIGIQPEQLEFGKGLSSRVTKALEELVKIFQNAVTQ